MTETPHGRLQHAREQAGYRSAAAFAKAIDASETTYRAHENGSRTLTIRAARQYATRLAVAWQWLMFGDQTGLPEDDLATVAYLQELGEARPDIAAHLRGLIRMQAEMVRSTPKRS